MKGFSNSRLATILIMLALLLAGLGTPGMRTASAAPAGAHQIEATITISDAGIQAPAQVEAGHVTFTFQNNTQAPAFVQFSRLNEGVTMDQVQAAMQGDDPGAIFGLVTLNGGTAAPPGVPARITLEIDEGTYLLSPGGDPSVPGPAPTSFEAVAGTEATDAPAADATVTMRDFEFVLPQNIQAGMPTWQIVNEGPQPHEMVLFKLAAGKTLADLQAALAPGAPPGPPPGEAVGGLLPTVAGKSAWVPVFLQEGSYVAVCFIPDPASGKTHLELGMIASFTIGGQAGTGAAGTGAGATGAAGGTGAAPTTMPTTGGPASSSPVVALLAGGLLLAGVGLLIRRVARRT